MQWTAVQFDFSKQLAGKVQPKRVKIPPGILISVVIDIDKPFYDIVIKDPSTLSLIHEKAQKEALAAIDAAVAKIKIAEAKSEKFDEKAAEIFSKDLTATLEKDMKAAGAKMSSVTEQAVVYFFKSQKKLKDVKIKSSCRIVAHAVSISASVAFTAASHGVLTPFAGIAIARSTVSIAQEVARLATDCTAKAKLVDAELKVLQVALGKNSKDLDLMAKIRKNGAETALAVLSGLAGVETPSLTNCKKHIEDHKTDIAKLDAKSKRYSEQIYKLMDVGKAWDKKCQEAVKEGKSEKIAKLKVGLKASEDALDKLLNSTTKVNEAVVEAWANHRRFKESIDKLSEGVQAWTKYVDVVVGATVDISLAVGEPHKVMEAVADVLVAVSNDAVQAAA
jgi:hypothetical protein